LFEKTGDVKVGEKVGEYPPPKNEVDNRLGNLVLIASGCSLFVDGTIIGFVVLIELCKFFVGLEGLFLSLISFLSYNKYSIYGS
jgi:hypothetical protein